MMAPMKILFVCRNNIYRSPIAHGLFSAMLSERSLDHLIEVDSAGTHAGSIARPPDHSGQYITRQNNIDITQLRSRQLTNQDCAKYDHIIGMDENNLRDMLAISHSHHQGKIRLLLDYAPDALFSEVSASFDLATDDTMETQTVYTLIQQGCDGLLCFLQEELHGNI